MKSVQDFINGYSNHNYDLVTHSLHILNYDLRILKVTLVKDHLMSYLYGSYPPEHL